MSFLFGWDGSYPLLGFGFEYYAITPIIIIFKNVSIILQYGKVFTLKS